MGAERRFVLDPALRAALRTLRAGSDDGRAMRRLDAELRPRLLRYFHERPFDREDAEDLVQKTLLLVLQHLSDLDHEERFVGWLFAIARNVKLTERERRRAERRLVVAGDPGQTVAAPAPTQTAEQALVERERAQSLERAIAGLPPRQRQCLVLRTRDELSYEEIADLLRLNALTVRNHLAEARKTLRNLLGDEEGRERA